MYICLCNGITESMVKGLAQRSICPEELACKLGVDKDNCCGKCLRNIRSIASSASNASLQSEQL
jgi:bacterioferritin-associated ferredoxin